MTEEFNGLSFELKNPLTTAAVMRVEPTLPPLLAERGWTLSLMNRGGATFKLEPGESREIVMQLQRGTDFTADDVEEAAERTIRVAARADGILVGGMSYELDPKLRYPTRFGGKDQTPARRAGPRARRELRVRA